MVPQGETMEENLLAGLVSGLIVSLIILVFRQLWDKLIVPWFEECVYKDVHIEGRWYGLYPETSEPRQDTIMLKRHGHTVSGIVLCKNGADEGAEYSLCGSFRNLILPLTYESINKSMTDRGTITLKSIKNGEVLRGKIALYNTVTDTIDSAQIEWFRSKVELEKKIKWIKTKREEKEMAMELEKTIIHKKAVKRKSTKKAK